MADQLTREVLSNDRFLLEMIKFENDPETRKTLPMLKFLGQIGKKYMGIEKQSPALAGSFKSLVFHFHKTCFSMAPGSPCGSVPRFYFSLYFLPLFLSFLAWNQWRKRDDDGRIWRFSSHVTKCFANSQWSRPTSAKCESITSVWHWWPKKPHIEPERLRFHDSNPNHPTFKRYSRHLERMLARCRGLFRTYYSTIRVWNKIK